MLAIARNELLDHRYRIVRWIGQGAWAVVYEAIDTKDDLNRPVAIKILNTELIESEQLQARFIKEAEASIHIDSPFVVAVHAAGKLQDGHPYIVMELLDGENLGQRLERVHSLTEEHAVEFAIHALSGLAHAHARGVLHRDVKPDNLVIVRSASGGEVLKIVDLGISKLKSEGAETLGLTRTNMVMGSPVYMSPEQARGAKHMDHRSDVYSLGVVLYECLTGGLPHGGDNFNELMFKIALEDAPDPRTKNPFLNPELVEIVLKALSRDQANRFQSASAFREALLEWGEKRGARVIATPSSSQRMRSEGPHSSRRLLEVTLDEDDDKEKASASANANANANAKGSPVSSDARAKKPTIAKSSGVRGTDTKVKDEKKGKAAAPPPAPPPSPLPRPTTPASASSPLSSSLGASATSSSSASDASSSPSPVEIPEARESRRLMDSIAPYQERSHARQRIGIVVGTVVILSAVLIAAAFATKTSPPPAPAASASTPTLPVATIPPAEPPATASASAAPSPKAKGLAAGAGAAKVSSSSPKASSSAASAGARASGSGSAAPGEPAPPPDEGDNTNAASPKPSPKPSTATPDEEP